MEPMVACKQIAQAMMNELEKSLTLHLSQHGGGSKDPAAMLSECLLNQKIVGEEMHPNIVASAPAPLKQTQTTVNNARCASLTPVLTAVDNARRAPLNPLQTPVDNARRAALTPVDNAGHVAPAPADDHERRALSSLGGVDLEEANRSTLLAATQELLAINCWHLRLGIVARILSRAQNNHKLPKLSQATQRSRDGLTLCCALTNRRKE